MEEEEEESIEYVKSGDKIVVFPDDIDIATNYLALSKTLIPEIPISIGNFINLTSLILKNNSKLESLPETIGNLTKLEDLNLENNNLSSLPETIGNLINLYNLNLENNKLSTLPETIKNLIKLSTLNLENNKLTYAIIPTLTALTLAIKNNSARTNVTYLLNGNNIEIPINHAKMDAKNDEDIVYVSITTHGFVPIDDMNDNKPILFKLDDTINSLEIQRACALSSINLYPIDVVKQDTFSELIKDKLLNSITCPTMCSIDDDFVTNCKNIQGDLKCEKDEKGDPHTGEIFEQFKKTYDKRYPKSKIFSKAQAPAVAQAPKPNRVFFDEIGNKIFSFNEIEYLIKGYKKRDWKISIYIKTKDNDIEEYDITKYLIRPSQLIARELLFSLYDFKINEDTPNYRNYTRDKYSFYLETLINFLHKTLNYKNIKIFDFSCGTLVKNSLWLTKNPEFLPSEDVLVDQIAENIEEFYGGKQHIQPIIKNIHPIIKKNTNKKRPTKKRPTKKRSTKKKTTKKRPTKKKTTKKNRK